VPAPSISEQPPEPAKDPELAAVRDGHDLHLKTGNPKAALDAYERYLARYPAGRFVPEARYNSALNLLKLGRRDAARRLLTPFAEGRYGSYRRKEASALLHALEKAPTAAPAPAP
jgi:tetratricopeptide (TPR) repeat protein